MPRYNGSILSLLCSSYQARSCSSPGHDFGATLHDDAHDAFITLSPYTKTGEGEVHHLSHGPKLCWLGP
jgi:hypothetical protein